MKHQLLENVKHDIAKLESRIAEVEPQLIELIKANIGKSKQPASIETQRRKLQRDRVKLQEFISVKEELEKEVAEIEEQEADAKLKEQARFIIDEMVAFANQVKAINTLRSDWERAAVALKHPFEKMSNIILACHEAGKMDYVDVDAIHRLNNGLGIGSTNPAQLDDKNLEIQTGLNRLSAALQGSGAYHKAKRPMQDAQAQPDTTEAEAIREQNELDRWKDGGPVYPQYDQ